MATEALHSMGVCAIIPRGQIGFQPQVYGMGILVDDEERRTVLTCSHVIDDAVVGNTAAHQPQSVQVCFPFHAQESIIEGIVVAGTYSTPQQRKNNPASDLAVIRLDKPAPDDVRGALLRDHRVGSDVTVFGFRSEPKGDSWINHPNGEYALARVRASLPRGLLQLDGLPEAAATARPGFSGAGVYDARRDCIVGMLIQTSKEPEGRVAFCISTAALQAILLNVNSSPLLQRKVTNVRTAPATITLRTRGKLSAIEEHLKSVGQSFPTVAPDKGLAPFLLSVINGRNPSSRLLQDAFGLPEATKELKALSVLVTSKEPSVQQLLSVLAQRITHLLWRYEATLKYIDEDWARRAQHHSEEIRQLCEPHILARKPRLTDVVAALNSNDFTTFTESAPDSTLYAFLRAFEKDERGRLQRRPEDENQQTAIDFIHDFLKSILEDERPDDSSNAWWALRLGLESQDERFRSLLPQIAARYADIRVPSEEVFRLSAVPEIYKPLRTASYTLSNIQAIFESRDNLEPDVVDKLHDIITTMLDRLLGWPINKHFYLVSVHHEGLRNYLDYIRDQNLPE